LIFGVILVLFLSFWGLSPLYEAKYIVFLVVLVLYVAIIVVWERVRRKRD
jgi:hypothetical protein